MLLTRGLSGRSVLLTCGLSSFLRLDHLLHEVATINKCGPLHLRQGLQDFGSGHVRIFGHQSRGLGRT